MKTLIKTTILFVIVSIFTLSCRNTEEVDSRYVMMYYLCGYVEDTTLINNNKDTLFPGEMLLAHGDDTYRISQQTEKVFFDALSAGIVNDSSILAQELQNHAVARVFFQGKVSAVKFESLYILHQPEYLNIRREDKLLNIEW